MRRLRHARTHLGLRQPRRVCLPQLLGCAERLGWPPRPSRSMPLRSRSLVHRARAARPCQLPAPTSLPPCCAGVHRSLGVHNSKVRSCNLVSAAGAGAAAAAGRCSLRAGLRPGHGLVQHVTSCSLPEPNPCLELTPCPHPCPARLPRRTRGCRSRWRLCRRWATRAPTPTGRWVGAGQGEGLLLRAAREGLHTGCLPPHRGAAPLLRFRLPAVAPRHADRPPLSPCPRRPTCRSTSGARLRTTWRCCAPSSQTSKFCWRCADGERDVVPM